MINGQINLILLEISSHWICSSLLCNSDHANESYTISYFLKSRARRSNDVLALSPTIDISFLRSSNKYDLILISIESI